MEDEATDEEVTDEEREHYVPPGARSSKAALFGRDMESHFVVPRRLADKPGDLIEAVNDFHYAMMNDHPRNAFYRECLRRAIVPGESIVLEIGTGSGLLAMLAARLGAKRVVAIEASTSLAELARRNIKANCLADAVEIIPAMSTEVSREQVVAAAGGLPDVVVAELFGTLLLGESALEYLRDARARLAKPTARVVPPRGVQYAVIVECQDIAAITSVHDCEGLTLAEVNLLQDTASVVFTKQYGFRFSSVPSRRLSKPVPVFRVDFNRDEPGFAHSERTLDLVATASGTAHCVLAFWDVTIGTPVDAQPAPDWERPSAPLGMSTDPELTRNNFARDMQWGQAIQLLEDVDAANADALRDPATVDSRPPTPIAVREGEHLDLHVRFSKDSVVLQFQLQHRSNRTLSLSPETAS